MRVVYLLARQTDRVVEYIVHALQLDVINLVGLALPCQPTNQLTSITIPFRRNQNKAGKDLTKLMQIFHVAILHFLFSLFFSFFFLLTLFSFLWYRKVVEKKMVGIPYSTIY